MLKEVIYFAHANSFPAKTYLKLFSYLNDEYEIDYLERFGHNPDFPVTDGWKYLAKELQADIESKHTQPIIGIGHSLGGILHFLNACENPHQYKAIILLDSPLVSRLSGAMLKISKITRLIDKYSPSRVARFRRNNWLNKDDALNHFKQKKMFRRFDAAVLEDYVNYATVESESRFRLLFEPKIEAKIYRTIPDSFTRFRGKLKVPAFYIGGTQSREARLARLGFMKKNFPFEFHKIAGTHLFPFEKPLETSRIVKQIIRKLSD